MNFTEKKLSKEVSECPTISVTSKASITNIVKGYLCGKTKEDKKMKNNMTSRQGLSAEGPSDTGGSANVEKHKGVISCIGYVH